MIPIFTEQEHENLSYVNDLQILESSIVIMLSGAHHDSAEYTLSKKILSHAVTSNRDNMWMYLQFFWYASRWPHFWYETTWNQARWVYSLYKEMETYYYQVEKEMRSGIPPEEFSPIVKFIITDMFSEYYITYARDISWDPAELGYDGVPLFTIDDFVTRKGYERLVNTYVKAPFLRWFMIHIESPYDDLASIIRRSKIFSWLHDRFLWKL